MSTTTTDAAAGLELDRVATELSAISSNLLASYARLARHAERVEDELVQANEELARRVAEAESLRRHLDAVHRALPCGVVAFRPDGAVASWNPRAAELLHAGPEGVTPTVGGGVLAAATCGETVLELPDGAGGTRHLALRRSAVREEGGSVVTIDDRSAERRLSAELAAQSKMAALGTMAGGIAHEVRNPLNAVRGFAALLLRELDGTTRAHRFAQRICQGVDEVDAIVESILGFAAPEKLTREEFAAAALVDEAVELARASTPAGTDGAAWSIETRVGPMRIRADRIKLRQALKNLVANAIQAQPRGGRVLVSASERGEELVVEVQDAGPGLAAAVRGRAGEPFLTTRAEGTGLGLALVHAIAAVHGGRFEIRSPGTLGGADARLTIPRTHP